MKLQPVGIKSIRRIPNPSCQNRTWDLQVAEDHTYLIGTSLKNHVVSHNTEARLSKFGEDVLFSDIDYGTVDFVDNYTGEFKEPVVLPARVPLVLLTAASGIAVGLATNFLPHNLEEVCNGVLALIDDPKISMDKLIKYIPAPDFPLGGIIKVDQGTEDVYQQGRGSIQYRSSADFETEGKSKSIILQNIPYGGNKSELIRQIAELIRDGKIEGVSDIRDESDKSGVRVCVELKPSAGHESVLNQIYNHTNFGSSFSMNSVAILGKKPQLVNLLDILREFVEFRREIIRRRSSCIKEKAESRLELVNGVLAAIPNRDCIMKIAYEDKNPSDALAKRYPRLGFSKRQADYIFDLPVRKFSEDNAATMTAEKKSLTQTISEHTDILKHQNKVDRVIKTETEEIREKFGTPRKTILVPDFSSITAKEMVKQQEVALVFMSDNTVKSTPVSEYRLTKKRATGVTGVRIPDGIYPVLVATANTHDDLMLITNMGNRYILHTYDLPAQERNRKPVNLCDFIPAFRKDECVVSVANYNLSPDESLVILSEKGLLKKQSGKTVMGVREKTTMFYPVEKGGKVVSAVVANNNAELLITTSNSQALRIKLENIREVVARSGAGVRGIRLKDKDRVLSVSCVDPEGYVLTVSKLGYVKRTPMEEFISKGRGRQGVRVSNLIENDELMFAHAVPKVDDEGNLFMMTNMAKVVRCRISDVPVHGRNAKGPMSKKLDDKEFIKTVSVE